MADDLSISQLIANLRHENWHVRYDAADQLKTVGDERAVEPLIEVLDDENLTVRFIAAMTLGIIKDERAIDPLIHVIHQNTDYDVLWAAAWALSEIGEPVFEPVLGLLETGNAITRDIAADVLGGIGNSHAIEPLAEVFVHYGLRDYPETGRFGAADTLEKFGDAAVPYFVNSLDHKSPEIRARAAAALGNIGSPSSISALANLLDDDGVPFANEQNLYHVYDAAAEALEKIGTPEALNALASRDN